MDGWGTIGYRTGHFRAQGKKHKGHIKKNEKKEVNETADERGNGKTFKMQPKTRKKTLYRRNA